ncbi:MAG: hypothetical protein H8E47_02915, partial [Anaerolineales bacterium]|nr:hypothetical protein [Anaerolineales bacterium]
MIFAVVLLTSGGRVATDPVEAPSDRVYASSDCASGWWQQGGGTDGFTIYSLASHPGSPKVYAGLWSPMEGVKVAASGKNTWGPTFFPTPNRITSLAIDPVSPVTIAYAGTLGDGIKRSADEGVNWTAEGLSGKEVWSLVIAPTATSIYAYAGTAGEIYTSTNGTEWNLAGGAEIGTEKFYALVVDPQGSRTAYVGTKGKGVHRTTDGGIGWTPCGLDGMTVRALTLHPNDSTIIYAGTQSHGVFKSTDGGDSWSANGLVGHGVLAISVNPRNPEFVYAGTYGDGVWASHDSGQNWHKMDGLADGAGQVYSLALFTPEGEDDCQILYAGTTDGVWARAVTS